MTVPSKLRVSICIIEYDIFFGGGVGGVGGCSIYLFIYFLQCYHQNSKVHICTKRSHKCAMNSIQNSFHTGLNSLHSSQRLVSASSLYSRLNFMWPSVCRSFFSEEIKQSIYISTINHTSPYPLITQLANVCHMKMKCFHPSVCVVCARASERARVHLHMVLNKSSKNQC